MYTMYIVQVSKVLGKPLSTMISKFYAVWRKEKIEFIWWAAGTNFECQTERKLVSGPLCFSESSFGEITMEFFTEWACVTDRRDKSQMLPQSFIMVAELVLQPPIHGGAYATSDHYQGSRRQIGGGRHVKILADKWIHSIRTFKVSPYNYPFQHWRISLWSYRP